MQKAPFSDIISIRDYSQRYTNISSLPFEDRFGLLVDQEWTSRKNNHLKRLIKQAKFSDTGACVEDIEYHADRNLDKTQIARLSACDFITEHHNLLLLGATGSGKTYIACALGMSAIRNFLPVKYIRLPELLTELAIGANVHIGFGEIHFRR